MKHGAEDMDLSYDGDECPFCSPEDEELGSVQHPVIGVCWHCSGPAYTTDAHDRLSCFPCAYSDASWGDVP